MRETYGTEEELQEQAVEWLEQQDLREFQREYEAELAQAAVQFGEAEVGIWCWALPAATWQRAFGGFVGGQIIWDSIWGQSICGQQQQHVDHPFSLHTALESSLKGHGGALYVVCREM